MHKYKLRNFKLQNNESIELHVNEDTFEPNLTTSLIIKACNKIIKENSRILDLGCGSGIIGNYFFAKKKIKKIYSSDISKNAVKCATYNAKSLKANFDIRCGALLENWKKDKFDIIINDISGISSKVSSLTDWFKSAPNDSGIDGIKFTLEILNKYKNNLKKNGNLVFPIIGLSNKSKIIHFMEKNLINYKILTFQDWPLPKELYAHKKLLRSLKNKNIINFDEKFDLLTTKTEIFCCN